MPKYNVIIRATITKTETVEAESESAAIRQAHGQFTTDHDGPENYDQETLNCYLTSTLNKD